jgi:hypothetical protein
MSWRVPGVTNPDTPALEILGEILGSGASSRLNREIRERKQIAHGASAGMFSLQSEGVFLMQAVTDPDKREAAQKESLFILEDLKKNGVTEKELDRARRFPPHASGKDEGCEEQEPRAHRSRIAPFFERARASVRGVRVRTARGSSA